MERLFIIIARINNILLLLVLLGGAGSIVWIMSENNSWRRRGAIEVNEANSDTKKQVLLNFGEIKNITGVETQMVNLTTQEKSTKFSSGGYGNETRNILFLNGSDKVARWLFKDHKNLVLVSAQLHTESSSCKDSPTKAIYFEYVSEDTNNDGNLSADDRSNIVLTKPDGTGFVEVLHDVNRVLSYEMLDQQNLSVIYQKGTSVKHAKYSVTSMKLESDQEIINVPSTL